MSTVRTRIGLRSRTGPGAVGILVTAVTTVTLGLAGCSLPSTGAAGSAGSAGVGTSADAAGGSTGGSGTAVAGTALAALATVKVAKAGSLSGYTREKFGQAWADVDHNGCDTRDDVLKRDLTKTTFRTTGGHRCVVLSGVLADPYTAKQIHFTKAAATKVQIDHVVPLADAWRTGASGWSTVRRTALANDPGNLLAVDGSSNESKGDSDASEWLPPNHSYRCAYVARQVGIKAKYHLTVTPAERDAIRAVLSTCRTQRALG
ncbi:MAG: HNH endonuclease family protein [Frankia sp.]